MERQTNLLLGAILVVGLVVLAILLQPTIEEKLAPELVTAWVAIALDGGAAVAEPVEITAGTPFRLYAVVEAEGPVYYTEAPALRLAGGDVPGGRLRRWERPLEPRVRWFTIEGNPPYVELASQADLERFRFVELYRPDWPLAWSVPGRIEPAGDDRVDAGSALPRRRFGTQRYHVSVEFFDPVNASRPKKRVASWGGGDVERQAERFPTVYSALPGRLATASRVFGLTQLELATGAAADLLQRVDELARRHLAFSRATVLRDQLEAAGRSFEELSWLEVDLAAGEGRWGSPAAPGDLLRAGDRLVVLYEDRGEGGVLDHDDLCFDFARGAAVRRLGDVFSGDGVLELASLGASLARSRR